MFCLVVPLPTIAVSVFPQIIKASITDVYPPPPPSLLECMSSTQSSSPATPLGTLSLRLHHRLSIQHLVLASEGFF
ncbi:unnamed protein product [Arctogadus glacialis]